jgi:hypothetical protein
MTTANAAAKMAAKLKGTIDLKRTMKTTRMMMRDNI